MVEDGEGAGCAVRFRLDTTDETEAFKDGEDVVAPLTFGGGDEHFDGIIEAEQAFKAGAVADCGIERVEDA